MCDLRFIYVYLCFVYFLFYVFFFSSRRRHTRCLSDWSSDVCSSDLQQNALLCGVRSARGDVVVTLDDDLQHPPEEVGKLLDELGRGNDLVYGTPVKIGRASCRERV